MDKVLRWGEACTSCRKISGPSKRNRVLLGFNAFFLVLSSSLTLLWVGWWRALEENDRLNLLEFVFRATGVWLEWVDIFFGLSVATFVYFSAFFLLVTFLLHARTMRDEPASFKMHFAYLILHAFVVLCCVAFIGAIARLYAQGMALIKLKIIYSAPILHLVIVAVLTVVVGFLSQRLVASRFSKSGNVVAGKPYYAFLGLCAALLLISYILPFSLIGHSDWMPCVRNSIPPRPLLLGHKGAVALAPENTKMSFEAAVARGSAGLESDLQISKDRKFFMMHDSKLKRTTNIASLYPQLANEPMVHMNSTVVESLNAGKWYIEVDPEGTVASATEAERAEMKTQRIPSFRDYLAIADKAKQFVLWDFKAMELMPEILQQTLDEIDEVGIDPKLVWLGAKLPWFPAYNASSEFTKNEKAFTWTLFDENRPEVDDLQHYLKYNISNRNIGYGKVFPTSQLYAFSKHNITSNVWVVNSRWMFSLLWCTGGVASVTTNHVEDFSTMTRPIGMMNPRDYINFAGLTVGLSLVVLSLWIAVTACFLKRSGVRGHDPLDYGVQMNMSPRQPGSYNSFDH